MKRLAFLLIVTVPLVAQSRLASDFEIARMEKQLARERGFEAQLSGHLNLGDVRAARNETALAHAEYTQALELAERERIDARKDSAIARYANATSYAGLAQAKLGRDDEAFALLEESVRYTSHDPETWNLYASAMRTLGYPRKAVAAARNAVAIAATKDDRLDLAVYRYALATALAEAGETAEAETLLVALTESLRSKDFAELQRDVVRAEAFEVYSSARGNVAAYVSLLNRAQLRLASLYERRGALDAARAEYARVLQGRSDDVTALAALARLARDDEERERRYAEAFEANPFSLQLVREYQRAPHSAPIDDTTTGGKVRKALAALARGELRAARRTLDALLEQFPANETLRALRREAEMAKSVALPSSREPATDELRALLEHFEILTPEQRVALDAATYESDVASDGTIDGVPVRFSAPLSFEAPFARMSYRILGVSGDALLLEPLGVRWQSERAATPRREPRREPVLAAAVLPHTRAAVTAAAPLDWEHQVLHRGTVDIPLSPDPAFLREGNGRMYVYARTPGILEEIDGDRVTRRVRVPPFASDLEIDGATAYLVYPRDARVRTVNLERMQLAGEIAVGAVPVDLAFAGGGTALTARILAIADPSAKRVWLTEATQSTAGAIARGFLRGLLGLGLFGHRSAQFPTGVDRVEIRGNEWLAYDSSTRTLYRFTKESSTAVATGVKWPDGTSVAQKQGE